MQRQEHRGYEELSSFWVSAKDLRKGDKVLLSDGSYGTISKNELKQLSDSEITYNFEVADFHTYFVGNHSIVVHNVCNTTEKVDNVDDALTKINTIM